MKKYLLILTVVVLGLSTSAMAAGHIELRVAPDDVNQAGYQTSEIITIQLYATDFYMDYPNDTIGFMDISALLTDKGGIASAPSLHSALAAGTGASPGTIVNSGGVLISNIVGYKATLDTNGVYPFPAVLHEFEFHVPNLPLSDVVTINLEELSLKNVDEFAITPAYTVEEPLEIHMPCCPGDTDNDGDLDIDDYTTIMQKLVMCNFIRTGYIGDPCFMIFPPPDPDCNNLWDPCCDIDPEGTGDGDIDIDDYTTIMQKLVWSNYYRTKYVGDPCFMIRPDDPCAMIAELWPCN